MTNDQREIGRKLRILEHAEPIGDVSTTCRYFGVGRASFTRWRHAYEERGEAGLAAAQECAKFIPSVITSRFLTFKGKRGENIRRFQYTAIDDATRVRALKIYQRHTQANAIDFADYVIEKLPFGIREFRADNGHEVQAKFHWQVEDKRIRHADIKPISPQLTTAHHSSQQLTTAQWKSRTFLPLRQPGVHPASQLHGGGGPGGQTG